MTAGVDMGLTEPLWAKSGVHMPPTLAPTAPKLGHTCTHNAHTQRSGRGRGGGEGRGQGAPTCTAGLCQPVYRMRTLPIPSQPECQP